jgi:hypothetical protein
VWNARIDRILDKAPKAGHVSQDQQSESKAWWQTLPGLLTAVAAILTAFTGLLVALNQMGLFHHAHPAAAPAENSMSGSELGPPGVQATNPASLQLRIPSNTEIRTKQVAYTLLSARLNPYSPSERALDFTIRMTNNADYDANFWAASFRLSVNGALQSPAGDPDEVVPAHSAREGVIEFLIPANASAVGLEMGDVGEGKPTIPITLQGQ